MPECRASGIITPVEQRRGRIVNAYCYSTPGVLRCAGTGSQDQLMPRTSFSKHLKYVRLLRILTGPCEAEEAEHFLSVLVTNRKASCRAKTATVRTPDRAEPSCDPSALLYNSSAIPAIHLSGTRQK